MQSILFSLLIAYTKAYDHESKGIIIKTKNETSYLATTRLKKTQYKGIWKPLRLFHGVRFYQDNFT